MKHGLRLALFASLLILLSPPVRAQVTLGAACSTSGSITIQPNQIDYCTGSVWAIGEEILSSGYVGIGTTAPGYKLDIEGASANSLVYANNTQTWTGTQYDFQGANYSSFGGLRLDGADAHNTIYQASGNLGVTVNGASLNLSTNNGTTTALTINTSSQVGIGTSSPNAFLDIGNPGATLGTMRLEGNTSGYVQLQTAAAAGSWTMTLPTSGGTSGYVLSTDGSGVTSWIANGSGSSAITLGTALNATNPSRSGGTVTGFYSAANNTAAVAANGIEVEQWNTVGSGNTYVNITPGASAAPTIGVGGTSSGLNIDAGSGTLTLKTSSSNGAINITPNGTGPVILTSGVATGTGATAAMQLVDNSLTTGNGQDVSSSSLTSGNLANLAVTGTAAATGQTVLNIATSGANGTTGQTTYGEQISNTKTGTGTNIGLYATASGGTNNYAAIFNNGNVGIGTTSPAELLTISNTSANPYIRITGNQSAAGTDFGGIKFWNTANANVELARITGSAGVENASYGNLVFYTYGAGLAMNEWMRINHNGNVGIGTNNPGGDLHIHDGNGASVILSRYWASSSDTRASSIFHYSGAYDELVIGVAGNGGSTNAPNQISQAKMVIQATGNVGIGTTSPAAGLDIGNPGATLGTMRLEGNTSGYVQLQSAAAAGSWTMTLPTSGGTSGYVLSTNGSGTTSWVSSGGTVTLGTSATVTNPQRGSDPTTGLFSAATGTVSISAAGVDIADFTSTGASVTGSVTASTSVISPTYTGSGAIAIKPGTDSATAVELQTHGGTNILDIDTTNSRVGIGTDSPGQNLQIGKAAASGTASNGIIRVGSMNGSLSYRYWDFGTSQSTSPYNFYIQDTQMAAPALTVAYSTGNVGIGTTSPGHLLDVENTGTGPQIVAAFGDTDIGSTTSEARIVFNEGGAYYQGIAASVNSYSPYLGFSVNSTTNTWAEKMRIQSNGNVGIGTTSPNALLDIGSAATTLGTMRLEGNTSGYVQLQTAAAAGSWTMTLPTSGGTSGYVLSTNGSGTTSWVSSGGGGTVTLGTSASVTSPQRSGDPTTGLFSAATGKVSVSIAGTDVADYSSTGETLLTSTSQGTGLTVNGQVWGTSFTPTSDQRLKKNIQTLEDALDRVTRLRGVSYDWRDPDEREIGHDLTLPTDEHQIGVIAQEVERVFPEAVGTGNNGVKNVNYNALVGPLIEAVKELHRELKAQQDTMKDQQEEIDGLRERLSSIDTYAVPPPASSQSSGFPTGRNGGR
jgi:hypothetical protein